MAKIIELVTNAGQVDVTQGIVEEVVKAVPEVGFFDAEVVPGTTISTLSRTSLPTAAFRNIGDPVSATRSGYTKRTAELKLLSAKIEISEAEAFANPLQTLEEMETDEGVAVLTAAFKALASQIWYGTGADAKGFTGLTSLVSANMVTKAGAGASNANTSVWFVGNGAKTELGLLFSKNSKILSGTDVEFVKGQLLCTEEQTVIEASGDDPAIKVNVVTGSEPGYIGDLTSWAGLHLANDNRVARLCNVTTTTGLNDDMLTDCIEAYAKANDGVRPAAIFMSYNARKMLRKSRTLSFTSTKGVSVTQFAPIPTDVDGIPLIATNALLDTEAVVS